MTPEEFVQLVEEEIAAGGLHLVRRDRDGIGLVKDRSEVLSCCHDVWCRFYVAERADVPVVDARTALAPAEHGWVELTPPRLLDRRLLLATLGSKWRWYDDRSNEMKENLGAKRLYSKVRRTLKKQLRTDQLRLVDVQSGASRPVRGIAWSPGARALADEGVELAQEGVRNTRFAFE